MASTKLVSIICPVFNEQEAVPLFYKKLTEHLSTLPEQFSFELIFTNNCSVDQTLPKIRALQKNDPRVQVITLSRNFGYQASLLSGLKHARGDALIVIDVDCEDPPELIGRFLAEWERGYDLVYGRRDQRPEPFYLIWIRKLFYRVTRSIADYDFILDMAEFSLFSARIRDQVIKNKSTYPFIRTELAYSGFKKIGIPYNRSARIGGKTHYNYWRMTQFALGGILSSSTFFLRFAAYFGLPLAFLNLVAIPFPQWTRVIYSVDLFYIVLILAFISTYIARIYKDGVGRPLYIIDWSQSSILEPMPERERV